jgi:ABC-type sugar transport system ATPase subunit
MAIADNLVILNEGAVEQVGSPKDIYENPKTMFVATFIGMLNLIPASTFKIDDGYDAVGFRPENAEIVEDDENISGTVNYVEYQGEETIVYIAVGDNTIRIRDRQVRFFEPGKKINIKIKKAFAFKDGKVVKTILF